MKKWLRPLPAMVLTGIMLVGCAGEDGAVGPAGPIGPAGPTGADGQDGQDGQNGQDGEDLYAWAWVGNNGSSCYTCHSETVTEWTGTGHPNAFATLEAAGQSNNPYCLQCHTLGWDAPVAYGDTTITDHGMFDGGYDDFWPAADEADTARLHALQGVQCESCHSSMGPNLYGHSPEISFATNPAEGDDAACATCHEGQMEEWLGGAHDHLGKNPGVTIEDYSAEWNSGSCWTCHGTQGFLAAYDPDYTGTTPVSGATLNQVGCVTCHDPHNGTNEAQLRTVADYSTVYVPAGGTATTFTGRANSQLCAQCHHARRTLTNVNDQVFSNASGVFSLLRGPHESPQMDMFLGAGSYEIPGFTYNRTAMHNNVPDPCVTCHMEASAPHGYTIHDHSFEASLTACQSCHNGATSFDIDFGGVNGVGGQTEVANLMGQIEDYFTAQFGFTVPTDSLSSTTFTSAVLHPEWTNTAWREAVYCYLFVKNDGSMGVHNPAYAKSLLTNALNYLNQ